MPLPLPSAAQPTLSFEFFPPKTEDGWNDLRQTLARTAEYQLDFVSVTYGAMGTTRAKTIELAAQIQKDHGVRSVAHLTCVGHARTEIDGILDQLAASGVDTILGLRGDPPKGQVDFQPHPEGFAYASDLIAHIARRGEFQIGCACYPEVHPQAVSPEADLDALKLKQDNGASFAITQLFYDVEKFLRFRDRARQAGVTIPFVAGLMPITNTASIRRFCAACGTSIPEAILARLEPLGEDMPAVTAAGVDIAVEIATALLAEGIEGLHLYTLNKSLSSPRVVTLLRERGYFPR